MKKLIAITLVLILSLSVWTIPGQAAMYGQGQISGVRTSEDQSRRADGGSSAPQLAEGNYAKWIDRLAALPEYAVDFYQWLEENANAEGALADPTRAQQMDGDYYYLVTTETGTVQAQCSLSDWKEKAQAAASEAMYEDFTEVVSYIREIYDVFDRDHPEVFWLSGSSTYAYAGSYEYGYSNGVTTVNYELQVLFYLKTASFDIREKDYQSAQAVEKGIVQRDEAVERILSQCPDTGVQEQLRYLNKVLTEQNAYNSAVAAGNKSAADASAWECISALLGSAGNKGPVCEGYARAFMVLCQQLGIPCVLVDGVSKASLSDQPEAHMWNNVQVDGKWYAVDVTWNDPYDRKQPTEVVSGFESEDWLLLGANTEVAPGLTFSRSHQVENKVSEKGLAYTNGPKLSDEAYVPGAATGSIGGTVSSSGDELEEMTIALYRPGEETPALQQLISGKNASFSFDTLESGTYTIKVSKPGHVSREYQVSTEEPLELDLKLCLIGDVTGDGRISVGDVARVYAHVKGNAITDAYALKCAEVSEDGKLTIGDTAKIYAHMRGGKQLF